MGDGLLIAASDKGRSLLWCYTISPGEQLLTIWRIIVPSDLGWSSPLCINCLTLKTKAQLSFRMCVIIYQLMCHVQEDLHLEWCHSENLKFCSMPDLITVWPILAHDIIVQKHTDILPFRKWNLRASDWVFKHSRLKCARLACYFLNGMQECCTNLLLLEWCIDFMYVSLHGLAKPCENMFPPNDILSADDLWCRLTAVSCMRWLWYAASVVICGLKVIVVLQGQRTCQTGCAYWGQTTVAHFLPTAALCLWSNG